MAAINGVLEQDINGSGKTQEEVTVIVNLYHECGFDYSGSNENRQEWTDSKCNLEVKNLKGLVMVIRKMEDSRMVSQFL